MRKIQMLMNKPIYLGLSILDLSKSVMYGFWNDYIKPKYGENWELCYMHAGSFIVHAKTDDISKILQNMLKQDLTFQILKWTDHYLKEKTKK